MSNALNNAGWIGPLPAAWDVVPLKHRTEYVSRGRSPDYSDTDDGVPVVNQACIYWDGLRLANVKRHRRETSGGFRGRLLKHDVLINSTGTGTLGRAVVFSEDGEFLADSHVTIVRASLELEPRYLRYLIETDIYQGFIYAVLAPGATNQIELSREGLRAMPIPAPQIEQQRSIADFLDRKTAAIDELIAKKERLALLLQEKRQAVIAQSVTKGLDPDVKMKETGIEWLPVVPGNWDMVPLRHLLAFGPKNGISPPPADTDGTLSFSISAVRDGRVNITGHEKYVALEPNAASPYMLRPGDILLMRGNGNLSLVGTCGLVDEIPEGCTYPDILMRMRSNDAAMAEYLVLSLNAPYVRAQIELFARTSNGTYKVSGSDVRSLMIAVPSVKEQQSLLRTVRCQTASLDRAVDRTRLSIAKLREYRQSFITAAVTGKLDVTTHERTIDDTLTALEASG